MRIAAAFLALATAGATLATATVPAFAEESRQVMVQYSDLNMAAPAGRSALQARVRTAARQVCGILPALSVKEGQEIADCREAVIAQAWNQISATASSGQVRRTR